MNITLYDAMEYIDNYITEAANNKEKEEILTNQDVLKKNFHSIYVSLRNLVIKNSSGYKVLVKNSTFFKDHKDHKEQHYLLTYTLEPNDKISKSEVSDILADIGNKVETEFRSSKKEFLDKGLYFDNKKKNATTRFIELHYDFY